MTRTLLPEAQQVLLTDLHPSTPAFRGAAEDACAPLLGKPAWPPEANELAALRGREDNMVV